MTKDHRFFHRRQAASATKVLTVNVEVVATVDTSGNLVGQETKTQAVASPQGSQPADVAPVVPGIVNAVGSAAVPGISAVVNAAASVASPAAVVPPSVPVPAVPSLPQVPAVPAVPTVALPTVPAVPPYPSDLTVPAYPFASGASALAVAATSSESLTLSPAPTSVSGSSVVPASMSASFHLLSNSTIPSMSLFSSTSSVSARSVSASSSASDGRFSVAAFTRSSTSDSDETSSTQFTSATSLPSVDTSTYYAGGGAAGTGYAPAGPAQTTAAAGSSTTGSTTPLPTPQVVGSVVGSLAGAALVLAIILFLLQRHKRRRQGALQLTDEATDRAPPMIQHESKNNRIPSAFLNRFSGMSRSTVDTTTSAGERSFQRVSGRKLPSAFSEGMTSEQFSRGGTLSGSSFYMDDQGTYGGPGLGKEFGKDVGGAAAAGGAMNIRPGPRRTPVIRHPDDEVNPFADPAPFPKANSHLSPPQSPNPDAPRGTLGRSLYSHDGSRSSKFTENV